MNHYLYEINVSAVHIIHKILRLLVLYSSNYQYHTSMNGLLYCMYWFSKIHMMLLLLLLLLLLVQMMLLHSNN